MTLDIIEIAEFCKEQLKRIFKVDFDILEDGILARVKDLILNSHNNKYYDILYDFHDSVYPVLQNLDDLNLNKIRLNDFGYSIEEYDEKYIDDVKNLIALYFITQYNYIHKTVSIKAIEVNLKGDLKELFKQLYDPEE